VFSRFFANTPAPTFKKITINMRYVLTPLLLALIGFTTSAQKDTSYSRADREFLSQQEETSKGSTCTNCPRKSRPPFTLIFSGLAKRRMNNYQKKIKDCGLNLASEVEYNIEGAYNLVYKLTNETDYDGFRAYFAVYPCKNPIPPDSGYNLVPPGQDGKLTVIYVPTRAGEGTYTQGNKTYAIHNDDTDNAMIINGDNYEKVSAKFASMWINKANHEVLDTLEHRRQRRQKHFNETHSLWYDIKYLKHSEAYWNGLIDILQYKKCCYPNAKVYAKFAAFPCLNLKGYRYKLSIVFQVKTGPKPEFITFYSNDRSHWDKYAFKAEYGTDLTDESGSDTGKPCPPPSPCGSNVGAQLPNQ
jgi:hypothetical protein